jgi:fermentation-respiration switch protein FrsA (DUF1100 family)
MSAAPSPKRPLFLSLLLLRPCPPGRKRWLYNLGRTAVVGAYLYLAGGLVLMALEDWLLFRPTTAAEHWRAPPPGLDPQDVTLTSGDGTALHAWWITPPNWTPEQGALLECHGNGGNLCMSAGNALKWRDELHVAVLLFDYPGYGKSAGTPSEPALYAAGDAAYDWLVNEKHVPANRVLLYGQSLGGAVAVDLAARRPHRALLLTSVFTSFPDVAQARVMIVPARWLAHNQFRSIDKIPQVATPVFIAHGTADHTIPFDEGERLFAAVTSEHKRFLRIEGGSHNLLPDGQIQRAVRDFLAEVGAAN